MADADIYIISTSQGAFIERNIVRLKFVSRRLGVVVVYVINQAGQYGFPADGTRHRIRDPRLLGPNPMGSVVPNFKGILALAGLKAQREKE